MTKVTMTIREHIETVPLYVAKLGHYPIVLGTQRLRLRNITIRFALDQMTFGPSTTPPAFALPVGSPP